MNEDVRFRDSKSQGDITREWDLIAPARDEQLLRDGDVSFSEVLKPAILESIGQASSIIDVGCGTGRLTVALRNSRRRVLGIDPSAASIQVARGHDTGEYAVDTLEGWVATNPEQKFDVAVVNMVLMDVPDLARFCQALAHVARGGRVIGTFTHPAFWPLYWRYASNKGFDYLAEVVVEAPFKTTAKSYPMSTTHIHRPLSAYIAELTAAGITVSRLDELRGTEPASEFPFPRFIAFEALV
jgi:SAM-dependent methyltransferase